ncbi:MAG: DUF4199 domain-containing protein [Bacteroidota bacterium]|nr:DUF4199 domain-containing protein [Bacteroidota bacterium]
MNAIIRKYRSIIHGNYRWAALKYGITMGIVLSGILFFRYLLGHPANAPIASDENWVVFVALLVMSLILAFHYRKLLEEKKMTFKEGFLLSFDSCVIACIVYAVFMYFYSIFIDNGIESFQDRTIDVMTRSIAEGGDKVELPEMIYLVFWGMMANIIMGILVAFITGIICRNEKSELVINNK